MTSDRAPTSPMPSDPTDDETMGASPAVRRNTDASPDPPANGLWPSGAASGRSRRPNAVTATAMVIVAILAVLFAMREAQAVVVPTLVAVFLAVLADTPVTWLEKRGLGRVGGTFLVVIAMVVVLLLLGSLMTSTVPRFYEKAPIYEQSLQQTLDGILDQVAGDTERRQEIEELLRSSTPETALDLASRLLESLTGLLGNGFLILLLLIFILLEIPNLAAKLEALRGQSETLPSIAASIRRYLAIKTLTSLLTGVIVTIFVLLMGIDFAVLWGLLAFMLNYVPNIGSFMASIPPVLLALVEYGLAWSLWVAVGYVVINVFVSNGLEPRWMGRGLGLSLLVVFLSLVLWGWLLGPLGMLLSVPLTASIRLAMLEYDSTRPIALLLGRKPITPEAVAGLPAAASPSYSPAPTPPRSGGTLPSETASQADFGANRGAEDR